MLTNENWLDLRLSLVPYETVITRVWRILRHQSFPGAATEAAFLHTQNLRLWLAEMPAGFSQTLQLAGFVSIRRLQPATAQERQFAQLLCDKVLS
jgi:hypothetical protein